MKVFNAKNFLEGLVREPEPNPELQLAKIRESFLEFMEYPKNETAFALSLDALAWLSKSDLELFRAHITSVLSDMGKN